MAECCRLMIDPNMKKNLKPLFLKNHCKLYPFLCELSRTIVAVGKSVGTCSEQRHSPTSQSSNFDWHLKRTKIWNLVKRHFFSKNAVDSSLETLEIACRNFIEEMTTSSNFPGVGCFLATQFLQLSSLLGITPLGCYSFAMVNNPSLGSGQLIQLCYPQDKLKNEDCSHRFNSVCDDINKIWDDGKLTRSLIENTMCELSRSYWKTSSKLLKHRNGATVPMRALRKTDPTKLPPITVIMDDMHREESEAKDVFYKFAKKDGLQGIFKLRYSGDGSTKSKPILVMKLFRDDGTSELLKLTNWKLGSGPSLVLWKSSGKARDFSTGLQISRTLSRHLEACCN